MFDLEGAHELKLRPWSRASIFRQEYVFLPEFADRHAFMERNVNRLSLAVLKSPTNMEGIALEQSDEAALKAEETGRAHHRRLEELIEPARRTEFTGNIEELLQFLRLGARRGTELGIGRH